MNEQTPPEPDIPANEPGMSKFQCFSYGITAIGFVGLGSLALLRWLLGMSERELMATSAGSISVWLFSGLWILGLVILLPFSVFARRRSSRPPPVRPMPWWGIFVIPFGYGDPDWTMPRWITWPIMTLFAFLLFFVIVIIVAACINAS